MSHQMSQKGRFQRNNDGRVLVDIVQFRCRFLSFCLQNLLNNRNLVTSTKKLLLPTPCTLSVVVAPCAKHTVYEYALHKLHANQRWSRIVPRRTAQLRRCMRRTCCSLGSRLCSSPLLHCIRQVIIRELGQVDRPHSSAWPWLLSRSLSSESTHAASRPSSAQSSWTRMSNSSGQFQNHCGEKVLTWVNNTQTSIQEQPKAILLTCWMVHLCWIWFEDLLRRSFSSVPLSPRIRTVARSAVWHWTQLQVKHKIVQHQSFSWKMNLYGTKVIFLVMAQYIWVSWAP